jgi:hypothetical protein
LFSARSNMTSRKFFQLSIIDHQRVISKVN